MIVMDVEEIKKYLEDGSEKDFLDACLRNLADVENPLRLSNFSYSLRELIREVLSHRAPDENIKKCVWFVPEENAKNGVTRLQRVKYAIQGGLPDKLLDEVMTALVVDTSKKVRNQVDRLSEFTHITEQVLYGKTDVDALSEEALSILLGLLKSIEVVRKNFSRLTLSKVTTEIVDRKIESQAYRATEGIPEIHTFRAIATKDVEIRNINEQAMLFYA